MSAKLRSRDGRWRPERGATFQNIAKLKAEYAEARDPSISVDTKKKELVGNFAREGETFTQVGVETLDHDFLSAGIGKVIKLLQ